MKEGMVSIIIPNYNYAHFLPQTLDSVLAQTYKNWELIVVDDNSVDNSRELVRDYIEKNPRQQIRLYHIPQGPSGTPTPVNLGIRHMEGEYFAWLSSDDIFHPEKLEKEVNILERHPEVGMVHTAFDIIDDDGKIKPMSFPDFNSMNRADFLLSLMENNSINGNTVLIRKEIFDRVGLFKEKGEISPALWRVTEVLKWYEISLEFPVYFIKEKLHQARIHKGKDPVYLSRIAPKLCGFISESFLKQHGPGELSKKLGAVEKKDEEYIETRVAMILSKYGKQAALWERLEKIKNSNRNLHHKILSNLKTIDHLDLAARHAHLTILTGNHYKDIGSYCISPPHLKYLDRNQLYNLASVLKKAGDIDTAQAVFLELLKKKPDSSDQFTSGTYFHLGEILLHQGSRQPAAQYFSQCLELNPYHKKAGELLNEATADEGNGKI